MTLPEAIRKGAMQRPQGRYIMFSEGGTTSCALGAAYEAVYGAPSEEELRCPALLHQVSLERLEDHFPELEEEAPVMPCRAIRGCGEDHAIYLTLGDVIAHLNDVHRWSREAIADWLETR